MSETQIVILSIGVVLLAVIALVLVVLIRALAFTPKEKPSQNPERVNLDEAKIIKDFQEMIRCKTVSNADKSKEDEREFEKFEKLLKKSFPNVFSKCWYEKINSRSLLFKVRGKTDENPSVLMAHYDVVSVEESEWQKPPFDAVLEDGVIWGRGTLDTKVTVNAILQSVENLLATDWVPNNDIYLAFGGNEEVNGDGATSIVEYFKSKGITPAFVLDEGGAVVDRKIRRKENFKGG